MPKRRRQKRDAAEEVAANEVDEFSEQRDKILLESYNPNQQSEDSEDEHHEVLAMDSDLESSDDDPMAAEMEEQFQAKLKRDMEIEEKITAGWGKKASAYYGADTADFDLMEREEEGASDEEREAMRLQQLEAQAYDEEDFSMDLLETVLSDKKTGPTTDKKKSKKDKKEKKTKKESKKDKKKKKKSKKKTDAEVLAEMNGELADVALDLGDGSASTVLRVDKDTSNLSIHDKLDIVLNDAPEVFGLAEELEVKAREISDVLEPVLRRARSLPARNQRSQGVSFLSAKMQLLLSYVLNINFLLMLRAEGRSIKTHPVVHQLARLRGMLDKMDQMEPSDPDLKTQINELKRLTEEPEEAQRVLPSSKPSRRSAAAPAPEPKAAKKRKRRRREKEAVDLSEGETGAQEQMQQAQSYAEEDMFLGLAEETQKRKKRKKKKKKGSKQRGAFDHMDDVGDLEVVQAREPLGMPKPRSQAAAAPVSSSLLSGDFDDFDDDDFMAGLGLYEAESKKSKAKKAERKAKHPKPVSMLDPLGPNHIEKGMRREIGQEIFKNRGLTRYRPKDKANPRKRYRNQYEKAIVKRNRIVKEFKGQEHNYGGEAAGIKRTVIKSTKL